MREDLKQKVLRSVNEAIDMVVETLESHTDGLEILKWDEYIITVRSIKKLNYLLNEVEVW
jgi:hypothetical protein